MLSIPRVIAFCSSHYRVCILYHAVFCCKILYLLLSFGRYFVDGAPTGVYPSVPASVGFASCISYSRLPEPHLCAHKYRTAPRFTVQHRGFLEGAPRFLSRCTAVVATGYAKPYREKNHTAPHRTVTFPKQKQNAPHRTVSFREKPHRTVTSPNVLCTAPHRTVTFLKPNKDVPRCAACTVPCPEKK